MRTPSGLGTVVFVCAVTACSSRPSSTGNLDGGSDVWSVRDMGDLGYDGFIGLVTIGGAGADLYLAGAGGKVLRSADSGANWSQAGTWVQDAGGADGTVFTPYQTFTSIAATGENDVWIGGSLLVHSADRGGSWLGVDVGARAAIGGVWTGAPGQVLVTTAAGEILKTTDGGAHWTQVFADSSLMLSRIWGSAAEEVYAVGGPSAATGSGVVLRSADGGTSWQTVVADAPCKLWSISGTPDGAEVYATGDCGSVTSSTDHGATWSTSGWAGETDVEVNAVWVSPSATSYFLPAGNRYYAGTLPMPTVCRSIYVSQSPGIVTDGGCESLPHSSQWTMPTDVWGTGDEDIWVVGGPLLWHRK